MTDEIEDYEDEDLNDSPHWRDHMSVEAQQELLDAVEYLADYTRDEISEMEEHPSEFDWEWSNLQYCLPPRFTLHYTPTFLRRFADEAEKVHKKLLSGQPVELDCVAQEMALEASIKVMLANHLDITLDTEYYSPETIDRIIEEMEYFEWAVFRDKDFLLLWNDEFLDADEIGAAVKDAMGMVNLHIEDWFAPFRQEVSA